MGGVMGGVWLLKPLVRRKVEERVGRYDTLSEVAVLTYKKWQDGSLGPDVAGEWQAAQNRRRGIKSNAGYEESKKQGE